MYVSLPSAPLFPSLNAARGDTPRNHRVDAPHRLLDDLERRGEAHLSAEVHGPALLQCIARGLGEDARHSGAVFLLPPGLEGDDEADSRLGVGGCDVRDGVDGGRANENDLGDVEVVYLGSDHAFRRGMGGLFAMAARTSRVDIPLR